MESQNLPVENRFVMKVKRGDDEFILSYPSNSTYQEAFNATLQLLLAVYDASKNVVKPSEEGDANGDQ